MTSSYGRTSSSCNLTLTPWSSSLDCAAAEGLSNKPVSSFGSVVEKAGFELKGSCAPAARTAAPTTYLAASRTTTSPACRNPGGNDDKGSSSTTEDARCFAPFLGDPCLRVPAVATAARRGPVEEDLVALVV